MFVARNLLTNYTAMVVKEIRCNFSRRDPGIYHRQKLLEKEDKSIDLTDYDYDLETDFTNVGSTYKDHLMEINKEKENLKRRIVHRKYFKEHLPNFLTWNDKEQIRYLHSIDSEEWSVEKLAEGFPALPHVIAKIVKPRMWEKKNKEKIENHDRSVIKNWELFKANKLNLKPEVTEHLKKFTHRTLNLNSTHEYQIQPTKEGINGLKVGTEFSSIITSHKTVRNSAKEISTIKSSERTLQNNITQQDTYVLDKTAKSNKHKKHVTLEELQRNIMDKKAINGKVLPDEEVLLQETKKEMEEINVQVVKEQPFEIANINTTKSVTLTKRSTKDYLLEYPEKIIIPKGKVTPGCLYKLNDCYYDDDGLFLYRVPGMYK